MTENGGILSTKPLNGRIKIAMSVHCWTCQGASFYGVSGDLSVGGFYLKTIHPLDLNKTLMVSFSLWGYEHEKTVNCKASVAWTNYDKNLRKPNLPTGVGMQFKGLLREDLISYQGLQISTMRRQKWQ